MAKETFVRLTDDIDGSEAVEGLTFALRGIEYEIDLNAKNVAALEKALEKFITAGRRVRATRSPSRRAPNTTPKEDLNALREWAKANGFRVADRGRVSTEVREAYFAANG